MLRRLRSVALLSMVLALSGATSVQAQNSGSPDLQMLLNLDLFRPQPNQFNGTESPNSGDTTLDQIRALNALGYLGTNNVNTAAGSGGGPGAHPYAPPPAEEYPQ